MIEDIPEEEEVRTHLLAAWKRPEFNIIRIYSDILYRGFNSKGLVSSKYFRGKSTDLLRAVQASTTPC